MASIFVVGDWESQDKTVTDAVREAIGEHLRPHDEGFILPGAYYSTNTMSLRNTVLALDASTPGCPYRLMSPEWGHGVGVIRLQPETVSTLLATPESRARALKALREGISNEIVNAELRVGPSLASKASRDLDDDLWKAGFDSENCCVGIYSAVEDRTPTSHGKASFAGTSRGHLEYYLVVKAGAGRCAEEFHTALIDATQRAPPTSTLDALLSTVARASTEDAEVDTSAVLRRVAAAGRRNRARIAYEAANLLGLSSDIDTVFDHACSSQSTSRQTATLLVDTVTNVLERPVSLSDAVADRAPPRWIYFAGATAATTSQGLALCSNVSEGFVLFETSAATIQSRGPVAASQRGRGTATVSVSNEMYGALPAGSEKMMDDTTALSHAGSAHSNGELHPDHAWIDQRFTWHVPPMRGTGTRTVIDASTFQATAARVEPPQLWGTHRPLANTSWARAMCAHQLIPLRLRPELVLLAGIELSKVRSAVRKIAAPTPRELS